jgi:hypothetical protein
MLPKRVKTSTKTMRKPNTERKSMEIHKHEPHNPESTRYHKTT